MQTSTHVIQCRLSRARRKVQQGGLLSPAYLTASTDLGPIRWKQKDWFPGDSVCMFTGIWFLFLELYGEFSGHKIYSGIVWEPAF